MDFTDQILIFSVARLAGVGPKDLAKEMIDAEANLEFLGELSAAAIIESTKSVIRSTKKKKK